MTHETLAPWAELVPNTGPMTVNELLALPDEGGWMYELVEGRLVWMPSSGDILGGLDVLPGFSYPVASLFQ